MATTMPPTSARSNAIPTTALRSDTREQSKLAALLGLNRDYIASVQNPDVARFDEILADDFLCSHPHGSLADRAMFLEQTARPGLMGDVAIIHAATAPRPAAATPTCGRAAAGAGSASRRT
ncbi:MAG: nuclear transport factor 2 family protein [Microvirga sp.]